LLLRRPALAVLVTLVVAVAAANPPSHVPNLKLVSAPNGAWTVYHRDNAHTGNDPTLPQVTSASTGWNSAALDEQVFASPLVYNGIVYTATLNNTVYALNQSDGTLVWQRNLGAPETGGWGCGTVAPQGILGTPVVDAASGRIYVTALLTDPLGGTNDLYKVFGLNLATGAIELTTPIPTNLGVGFDWTIQQQRGALAVANGYIYVPFGGRNGDCGAYHGWVFAVATNGAAVTNFYQTPGQGASFWSSGGLAVDNATGNVFAASGNGTASGCAANLNGTPTYENDAVVRLSPTLAHLDAFVPQDWQAHWCNNDEDLGSAGPMLISSNLLFQAGKWGGGFLLNPNNLGGMDGQLFPTPKPAAYSQAEVCFGNHSGATFGSFAFASPFVYLECEGRGLVALNVNTATPSFSQCTSLCAAPDWHVGGSTTFGPPIVAAGAVWVASNGGGLIAYNAASGALIFQSYAFGINRFVTPAEAGGQVFVPSGNVIRSFTMNFGPNPNPPPGSLGGVLIQAPAASSWGASRVDVFAIGTDSGVYQRTWDGSSWSGWASLGGRLTSRAAAVSWGPNRIDVFGRGTDGALYHRWWDTGGWHPWEGLGGRLLTGAGVASWGNGRLDVFVVGTDSGLYHKWFDSGGWHDWEGLGGRITADPSAVSWGPNRVDVFVRGTDNAIYHRTLDTAGWHAWDGLGGNLISGPAASSCTVGHLDVFAVGTDSAVYRIGFNGGWGAWQGIGGPWTSDPGAVCPPASTNVDLFERGQDLALWETNVSPT
jgi:outer membrane protein assembly factor BamB